MKSYFKKPPITEQEKKKLNEIVRARLYCENCGTWALSGGRAHDTMAENPGQVHHVKTRKTHGDAAWVLENMFLLCPKCHDGGNIDKINEKLLKL